MKIKIGCAGLPDDKKEYYSKLKLVELEGNLSEAMDLEPAKKLRVEAPSDFEFILKIHTVFNQVNTALKAWERAEKMAVELKTKAVVFQLPDSVMPTAENKNSLKQFFNSIDRKNYGLVWEPSLRWPESDIRHISEECDLAHCVDPFAGKPMYGAFRYFRLYGLESAGGRFKGWDLKKLKDLCENEAERIGSSPIYVIFNNATMFNDALRFKWITENTGRIKEMDLSMLKSLCHQIELVEEDEKVQKIQREAEKVISLILYTDYARVDIEIEKSKLRELCRELFPDKVHLYEMVFAARFDRIWEQFRERKES